MIFSPGPRSTLTPCTAASSPRASPSSWASSSSQLFATVAAVGKQVAGRRDSALSGPLPPPACGYREGHLNRRWMEYQDGEYPGSAIRFYRLKKPLFPPMSFSYQFCMFQTFSLPSHSLCLRHIYTCLHSYDSLRFLLPFITIASTAAKPIIRTASRPMTAFFHVSMPTLAPSPS